jgi:hypothetical protein
MGVLTGSPPLTYRKSSCVLLAERNRVGAVVSDFYFLDCVLLRSSDPSACRLLLKYNRTNYRHESHSDRQIVTLNVFVVRFNPQMTKKKLSCDDLSVAER